MESSEFVVPKIDFEKFGESEIESFKKMREACEEVGIIRIVNHGVSPTLMSEMKGVARSLFDRPIEIKRRNVNVESSSMGYASPSQDNPLFESLGFYGLGLAQAQKSLCDQLDATPHERDIIERYSEAVDKLIVETRRKLTKSIGLLDVYLFKEWPLQLKINKYHFSPENLGNLAMRTHTDSGFFTILQDDEDVEGLEVMSKATGEFEAVRPCPHTFLLLIGDLAKAWSNGRFHNAAHTVRCKKTMTRFSIVTQFFSPNDEVVEAPSELVDDDHPRLYAPFLYEDFKNLRLSKSMVAGEALDLLRLSKVSPAIALGK